MTYTLHRVRSASAFCAWQPKPSGFQLLRAGRFAWWIFLGAEMLAEVRQCTKEAGGGWMLWYPSNAPADNRCPQVATLEQACHVARRLARAELAKTKGKGKE